MKIAIISDIHEDFENLRNVIDIISDYKPDKLVCLGDIVGFEKKYYEYADTHSASKCIRLLVEKADWFTLGNHELEAIKKLPEFHNEIGFPEDWYHLEIKEKEKYKNDFFLYKDEDDNDLEPDDIKFLHGFKSFEVLKSQHFNIMFSHFIYPDINGNRTVFFNDKNGFKPHFSFMDSHNVKISFIGHAHIEGVGIVNGKGLRIKKFGKHILKSDTYIILCPTIARSKIKNGFVLFDMENLSLEVVKI